MWIKICGVTTPQDALLVVEAGADALGVNLVPGSKRRVDEATARAIVAAVRGRIDVVGVIADESAGRARELRAELGLDLLQLHGDELPEQLVAVLPAAYKAVRIADAADVGDAARFAGERLLCDAKVEGALGGTGARFDWSLVVGLARARNVVLAGGLTPDNVAEAIRAVEPYGVDVASGVERSPRIKDPELVRRFVAQARGPCGVAPGAAAKSLTRL